jgi:photosystem II stability/assembly factor-like uncharacterized protein
MKTLITFLITLFCITNANAVEWTIISSPIQPDVITNRLGINQIKCSKDGKLYAVTDSGLFFSSDYGTKWIPLIVQFYENVPFGEIHFNSSGHIYCMVYHKILRTTNSGKAWKNIYQIVDMPGYAIGLSDFIVNKKNTIFISEFNIDMSKTLKLMTSVDNGDSWVQIDNYQFKNDYYGCNSRIFMTGESNYLFYLIKTFQVPTKVFGSSNGGNGWVDVTNAYTKNLFASNDINDEIYAGSGTDKPQISRNANNNWTTLIDLSNTNYLSIPAFKAVDKTILVATNKNVIYMSEDNGELYQTYSFGTSNNTINSFSYDNLWYYYCVTNEGIYRSKVPINPTDVEDNTNISKTDFNISPNPAIDNISISFSNLELSNPSISIFNSLGIEMKFKPSEGWQPSKGSSINISTEEFPTGVYYCSFNSGIRRITKSFVVVR